MPSSPSSITADVAWAAVISRAASRIDVDGSHTTGSPRSNVPTGWSARLRAELRDQRVQLGRRLQQRSGDEPQPLGSREQPLGLGRRDPVADRLLGGPRLETRSGTRTASTRARTARPRRAGRARGLPRRSRPRRGERSAGARSVPRPGEDRRARPMHLKLGRARDPPHVLVGERGERRVGPQEAGRPRPASDASDSALTAPAYPIAAWALRAHRDHGNASPAGCRHRHRSPVLRQHLGRLADAAP